MKKNIPSIISGLAALTLAMFVGAPLARALDPVPDYKTLIFPALVPKSGHGTSAPPAYAAGGIQNAFATTYEQYWKEVSYHDYDDSTGLKLQGYYIDTKTYGYAYVPWPLSSRGGAFNRPAPFFGSAASLFYYTADIPETAGGVYDETAALPFNPSGEFSSVVDGFWTPGEAFEDLNGDGRWNPTTTAEDFWNVDNNSPLRTNACGNLLPRLEGANGVDWSASRAEFYADYDGGTVLDGSGDVEVVDYDQAVTIYVADVAGRTNNAVVINEFDITPASCPSDPSLPYFPLVGVDQYSNEGDFYHTYVNNGNPGGQADIDRNNEFDYNVDVTGKPLVSQATLAGSGADAFVTYQQYQYSSDGSPYTDPGPFPNGVDDPEVVLVQVQVPIYQSGELFNQFLVSTSTGNIYGDPLDPANEDGTWTPGSLGEPFEDFISWWDPYGGPNGTGSFTYLDDGGGPLVVNGVSPNPLNNDHPSRGQAIDRSAYEDYIRWNYPGDADALIALADNGMYDGPEAYNQGTGTSKLRQSGYLPLMSTPEPGAFGDWDDRLYADWQEWWETVFGSPPPAWKSVIPNLSVYAAQVRDPSGSNSWIPYTGSWGYNAPREFSDIPSSMYYIGSDPANVSSYDSSLGVFGGDGNLGESTSPWTDSIYGQDVGTHDPNSSDPPDTLIPSGGPFVYNVHGLSGYDAGNNLNIEMLTRRYEVPAAVAGLSQADMNSTIPHEPSFKDVNLDGMVDHGALNTLEPNYATGRYDEDSAGNVNLTTPPYNNARFVAAMIAAWDQSEDFDDVVSLPANAPSDIPVYFFPIYPPAPGPGSATLGGTSGQATAVLTRDLPSIGGFLQVRPMAGGTIGGADGLMVTGTPFGMGVLTHEQGHDILGWPDLYDYDTWTVNDETFNTPIGGYDLMSTGGLVHGIPDLKGSAGWISPRNLKTILVQEEDPVTLELYPVTRRSDQYYYFLNPDNPGEYFYVWYADDNTNFGVPGGKGVYISHSDLGANPNAVPNQQRQNDHFLYEMLQADGLNQLQDGVNSGDAGDPFPGSTDKRIFTEATIPDARWWSQTDSGLRILDVEIPAGTQEPARVTFQWVDPNATVRAPTHGVDSDGDGIVDAWEIFYFGNLTTATGTSDYRNDGITDLEAFLMDIDPTRDNTPFYGYDEDGDGLTSLEEVRNIGTDPKLPDTDDDGISDGDLADTNRTDSTFPSVDRVLDVTGSPGAYVATPPKDRFRTPEFSLMAWINPRANGGSIFSREQTFALSTTYDYQLNLLPDGRIEFLFSAIDGTGDVELTTVQQLPLNQWTHVAAVFDEADGQMEIFFNGSQVASKFTLKRPPALSGARVDVTRVAPGIDGMLDETVIFNAPLTVEDIRRFMGGIGGQTLDSMVAYYRFDDGTSAVWDPVDARWEGTSMRPDWYRGQVQEFTAGFEEDWKEYWENSGTLVGEDIAMVPAPTGAPVTLSELDTNGDGIPDQWYIEHGFDPVGPSVAYQDQDGDGVWNRIEYELGTDPYSRDSDQNGINDGDEDDDGDGLTNLYEQSISGTLIDSADTDDDGLTDWEEITGKRLTSFYHIQYQNWIDGVIPEPPNVLDHIDNNVGVVTASNPLSSRSPERKGFLRTDASGYVQIPDQTRHALRSWTLEAWVRPAVGNTGGAILRRTVSNPFRPGTGVNYEIGLEPNGRGGLRLYALHTSIPASGTPTVTKINRHPSETVNTGLANRVPRVGEAPLPVTGDYPPGWTHVAASFDAENHRMILYINGVELSRKTDAFEPEGLGLDLGEAMPHPGELRIGDGFNGSIDNVMILAGASSQEEILASATGQNSFEDTIEQYPSPLGGSLTGGAFSALSPASAVNFPHVPGEILVRFKPEVSPTAIENTLANDLGLSQRRRFSLVPLHLMAIEDGSSVEQKLEELAGNPNIFYAEPNYKVFKHATPNDPLFEDQWALANTGQDGGTSGADIDALDAWDGFNFGSRRVRVAVIDTGVDYTHPDLWANMWPGLGYDFVDDDNDPMDGGIHGTHIAGIIGAVGNNGTGIAGVNWRTEIMALRYLGPGGGSVDDGIAAIEFAVDHGAKISNNSYGRLGYSRAEFDAIAAAGRRGHLYIASAGNGGLDVIQSATTPASLNLPNMITVAATDRDDQLASFSNFSKHAVHLAAPGVEVLSTIPGGGYQEFSGTSIAASHVTGVAALIMAQNPHLDVRSIRSLVLRSVDKLGNLDGMVLTGGRLNAAKALGGRGALVGFYSFNDRGATAEDFSYAMDWENDWAHAGTLSGNAAMIPFGGFLTVPLVDCVASNAGPLDPLGAAWTVNGWRCDNQRAHTGTFSATAGGLINNKTPRLGNGQSASLSTRVIGPGVVTFTWSWGTEERLLSDTGIEVGDHLRFLVNNTLRHSRNGWTSDTWGSPNGFIASNYMPIGTDVNLLGWETLTVSVPSGDSTLKWEYKKDSHLAQYPDAVWVDSVSFEHTGPDSDGDGIPDAYETAIYKTNPMVMDTDGDGILDGKEIELGTNPLVAEMLVADGPPVGCANGGISWTGIAGMKYMVQRSTDMMTWDEAFAGTLSGQKSRQTATTNGQAMTYCDPDPDPPSPVFYRVIILP